MPLSPFSPLPSASPALDALRASPSQLRAIEAEPGALLVLAGPGAGKTYCLTERIRYLIERHRFDPARICAFTFTNKAAGEIAHRLEARLGAAAAQVKGGTIHAFCTELLRKYGDQIGLDTAFGIADEEYQSGVLRRLGLPRQWHGSTLTRFSAFRFRGDALYHEDLVLLDKYERYLADRNVLDFDNLVIRAAQLLERSPVASTIRARWDVVLVDEFQDLNPLQYRVVRALAADRRHVFAVGDHEQSIYSWAGADSRVFNSFMNDFGLSSTIDLEENHRCPHEVFALARRLVNGNTPLFADRKVPRAERESPFPVRAFSFDSDDDEAAWIVDDVRLDRQLNGHAWGDVALLYRKHDIGDRLEAAFLNAGIRCQLPRGHALSDDPVVAYVIAAARVIANPNDELLRDAFFHVVLPESLYDEALAKSAENRIGLNTQLGRMVTDLPRGDENGRQIRRALYDWRNLAAVGRQYPTLEALVQELLSRRVGKVSSVLVDNHDEISDPAGLPDVVALATRLRDARARGATVFIPPMNGLDIPIKAILTAIGVRAVRSAEPPTGAVVVHRNDVPSVGLALGVFKAAQLIEMEVTAASFTKFTAVDIETTDRIARTAEIVEIAAVRVRGGEIVDNFSSLVKPGIPISPVAAAASHHLTDADVDAAPSFAEVWPDFLAFCGEDVVVAHNGYRFDFPIMQRMASGVGAKFGLCTFDTLPLARDLFPTSRKLGDLARHFGIDTGTAHRALDDTLALAHILLALGKMKQTRARKTALVNLLDHLGVALALGDDGELPGEGALFRKLSRSFALGPYSECLESYEREQAGDESIPTVDEIIERLGGELLREKLRKTKTADERYPAVMARLRRLLAEIPAAPMGEQLSIFLDRVVLSQKTSGFEPERERVNLLTLHSTKGLEFSRVYIVGAEDAQMPGGSPMRGATVDEVEESRRLLYVGMTRTIDRLLLTRVETRGDKPTGGHRFLDEIGLNPGEATH